MAASNVNLLNHPAAQRFPKNEREWLDFIKVLVDSTITPTDTNIAVEAVTSLTGILPNDTNLRNRVSTTESNIASNTSAIGVNTSNIATNTTNISTNLTSIEELKVAVVMRVFA